MDNQSSHIQALFVKYTNGSASLEEVQELLSLLSGGKNDEEISAFMQQQMAHAETEKSFDIDRWENVLDKIKSRTRIQTARSTIKLWPKIAVAAAIATMIFGIGLFYFNLNDDKARTEQVALKNDVAPGKNGATITLDNGKVIELSDSKTGVVVGKDLKYSDGSDVQYGVGSLTSNSMMLTASTAKGQTYQFTLPDGTKVWLNSDSKISFPAQFSGREREILLEGEGYFEVTKDKAHPFIVATDKQEVEVLGTHFNINSYVDEPLVATTLIEGSVRVSGEGQQKTLKPGEQAMNNGTTIKVGKADLETAMDWKNNEFYLEKMNFRVAMRKIARWYNVEVIYSGLVPEKLEAGGWIPRNSNLSDVLKAIEATGQVNFRIEGRRLYVSK